MPIYEYDCTECEADFELLIRGDSSPVCPKCGSSEVEKRFSLPAVKSSRTRAKAMRAAKKRDQRMGDNQMRERVEYESSHDD